MSKPLLTNRTDDFTFERDILWTTAGFGYVHFSPPDSQENREVWKVAYIEAAIHPNKLQTILPEQLEVTLE